mgnify:CR=1 FL=1
MEFAFILLIAVIWAWREFVKTSHLEQLIRELENTQVYVERTFDQSNNIRDDLDKVFEHLDVIENKPVVRGRDPKLQKKVDELRDRKKE